MVPGREAVSCWAGFRPSAGGSEPYTDKTGSTYHCVVSFVVLGNLSNMASKQKTATFVCFISTADRLEFQSQDDCDGRYLMFGIEVVVSANKSVMCSICHTQVTRK